MFQDTLQSMENSSEGKVNLWKRNPAGYFVSSMLAGMFVAFGGMVSTVMGAYASDAGCTVTKLIVALMFSSALSLVIAAGGELFTGNNMSLVIGACGKRITWWMVLLLWLVCWIGNLAGSWMTIGLYQLTGSANESALAMFAANALAKVSLTPVQMVVRGILCNICVCLGVWCAARLTNECAKLIMVIWCILIFMLCGFEHSVANMSSIGIALINGAEGVTMAGYVSNLLWVTLGNIIGGACFVALPYVIIGRRK